jgi:NAD(P)H-dependent flavin oxidoreductase YrpB (nitropropane dioxygenase family)
MPFFNAKYPIICTPMNKVSDAKLALAAQAAGIIPSLVASFTALSETAVELEKFNHGAGNFTDLILAATPAQLSPELIDVILTYNVTHLQLLADIKTAAEELMLSGLKKKNIKIIVKRLSTNPRGAEYLHLVDAIDIKGPEAASRVVNDGVPLSRRLSQLQVLYPELPIIVTGGISTSAEIRQYLDAGAVAVGLGTVFALSEESCINYEKKLAMLEKSFANVRNIGVGKQNAIIFTPIPDKDSNHTAGLLIGRDSSSKGLLFAGKAIDNISSIKSVATIVKELTVDL